MYKIDPVDWDTFKGFIKTLKERFKNKKASKGMNLPVLFRGQSNSKWNLESSLSRLRPNITFCEYKNIIADVYKESQDISFAKWGLTEKIIRDSKWSYLDEVEANIFDYIIYLRHQGFPTPILDWSKNYLIAAFFAFEEEPVEENIAIFSYAETSCAGKGYELGGICVKLKNEYSKAHPRHIKQEACYTVCHQTQKGELIFPPHYNFFNKEHNIYYDGMQNQDIYHKFLIPASERSKVLEELDKHGINRKTLFPNEDEHYDKLKKEIFKI